MNLTLLGYLDVQNIYNYKIPQRSSYDFWENRIITSSDIGILPSIGISFVIYLKIILILNRKI